ncbi:uncharacterized protein [Aegilops tauschii subsp. strangulata]|nr:ATG8-interacting protein 2 isoform X1 [Aegilops tauschii subsp. strangulata]XP_045083220.1 ATG8-interacting protein 2 isoform X1 [Aegilops tauschii subsp. strangulata]
MADSGGSDWEVVSLTASTYAAAPGPISPIHDTADKAESPLLLLPNPPAPPAHFFMSQHFNLPPLFGTHLENNSGGQELESDPAMSDGDADHLNMPICPENYRDSGRDDLQVEGGGGEELQRTTMLCSLADATAGADAAADATAATLPAPAPAPAPAATQTVAAPSGGVVPCKSCNAAQAQAQAQAQAWWEKTFSFPRQGGNGNGNGNGGTQPLLAFRFVFVAGKLQLQEQDHLSTVPEFVGVHGQTQKISCVVTEPLGQVKGSMLGGGSPVAQQG